MDNTQRYTHKIFDTVERATVPDPTTLSGRSFRGRRPLGYAGIRLCGVFARKHSRHKLHLIRRASIPVIICCSLLFSGPIIFTPLYAQSPGADSVLSYVQGTNGGFGSDSLPEIALGIPHGAGELEGSLDVVSLGVSGEITVVFEDEIIVDGPGPDFTVFENPFFVSGDSLDRYIETAIVEVSSDGVDYIRFPFDIDPEITPPGNPHRYTGLAGIDPVMSSGGVPDPTDPTLSGGDQFDLETVGLANARFVRIIDTGTDTYDEDGDLVTDTGLDLPPQAGFDLDAVCRINWTNAASPFSVLTAVIIEEDVIRVGFSAALDTGQEIPPSFFSLDGIHLTGEDRVARPDETTIDLILRSPLYYTGPPPVLSVSQHIRSATGENLLDKYDEELTTATGIENEVSGGERQYPVAMSCYPNPSTGSTTISFEMQEGGDTEVTVRIFNLRGRLVSILSQGTMSKGVHRITWDGRDGRGEICPSGIYFVDIAAGSGSSRLKIDHRR